MSSQWRVLLILLASIGTLCVITISPLLAVDDNSVNQGSTRIVQSQDPSSASIENRFEKIEKTLESIRVTGEKAEDRSYFNKLVSFEVFKYLKVMVALLILIALGFPLALAGTLGYIWAGRDLPPMLPGALGYIYLPGLLIISIASMSIAPLGARTAHGMDIRPLKRVNAIVLYILSAYFFLR